MAHNGRSAEIRQSREEPSTKSTSPERDRRSQMLEGSTHPTSSFSKWSATVPCSAHGETSHGQHTSSATAHQGRSRWDRC